MREAVRNDASKDVSDASASIPDSVSEGMLGWLIPHGSDHGEAWVDRRLEDSEEDAQN